MANYYRIVCVEHEGCTHNVNRGHIVRVGTGPANADRQWTIAAVLAAMANGDTFFTKSESTGKIAFVHSYTCSFCGRPFIKSAPDAVHDNNLDNMRTCAWV